ncbi:MAG: HAD family hydrolase [Phycisphaerales bacterium]
MPPTIRLVLFDIAGTLMQEDGHTVNAYREIIAAEKFDADDAWIRSRIGMKKPTVMAELLAAAGRPEAEADGLAEAFDAIMLEELHDRPPQRLGGAAEAFAALAASRITVGCITGFSREVAEAALAGLNLQPALLVGSDEVPEGRPAPDLIHEAMRRAAAISGDAADVKSSSAAQVAVVGDTPRDLECGTAAGCGMVVGVGHGTYRLDELQPHPHSHLLEDLHGLAALVI